MSKKGKRAEPEVSWPVWLDALSAFRAERGHVNVDPFYTTVDGKWLGGWLLRCRREYAAGALPVERETDLRALGVDLEEKRERPVGPKPVKPRKRGPRPVSHFEDWLAAIVAYRDEHGHTDIPNHHITAEGRCLGAWLTLVRQQYRAGTLPTEKADALTALGYNVARFGRPPARPRPKPMPWRPAGW
jgi:hypothetical protein